MNSPAAPAAEAPQTAPAKKAAKAAASKKSRAPKKAAPPRRRAPILLEAAYTLFVLVILGTGLSTALISWLAGADLLMVVVRAGGALLVTGLILWIVYWLMANGVVEARRQLVIEEAQKRKAAQAEQVQSTMEFEA